MRPSRSPNSASRAIGTKLSLGRVQFSARGAARTGARIAVAAVVLNLWPFGGSGEGAAVMASGARLRPSIASPAPRDLPGRWPALGASHAPAQPTPPFPTLVPTEPLPTLPPSVPTPAPFTPTPTPIIPPSATATPATPISPTASPTPTIEVTPSATSFLGLANTIHLPFIALFHSRDPLVLEPLRVAWPR